MFFSSVLGTILSALRFTVPLQFSYIETQIFNRISARDFCLTLSVKFVINVKARLKGDDGA